MNRKLVFWKVIFTPNILRKANKSRNFLKIRIPSLLGPGCESDLARTGSTAWDQGSWKNLSCSIVTTNSEIGSSKRINKDFLKLLNKQINLVDASKMGKTWLTYWIYHQRNGKVRCREPNLLVDLLVPETKMYWKKKNIKNITFRNWYT